MVAAASSPLRNVVGSTLARPQSSPMSMPCASRYDLERVDVVVHQLERLHELVELGQVHAAALLAARKQCGHLGA